MTDPNATIPPNTPRTWLRRAWAWCVEHREYSVPIAAFAAGWVLGKIY